MFPSTRRTSTGALGTGQSRFTAAVSSRPGPQRARQVLLVGLGPQRGVLVERELLEPGPELLPTDAQRHVALVQPVEHALHRRAQRCSVTPKVRSDDVVRRDGRRPGSRGALDDRRHPHVALHRRRWLRFDPRTRNRYATSPGSVVCVTAVSPSDGSTCAM